jgi:type IV secretion system protein VirB9
MNKRIIFLLLSGIIIITGYGMRVVQAASLPRRVAADRHVKTVSYDPNNVVIIHGRYGYQTQIVFAANEVVQNVSLGDSLAWQAVPVNHNLFIKPMAASKTNMTVLTNTNSYSFQLDSTDTKVSPTYKLQFVYSTAGYDNNGQTNAIGVCDPTRINWKYSFTGDKRLAPREAFDCNGQFTYFRFNNNTLPAIFIVDKYRKETLVNYHMKGHYVVVNTTAPQFTLRSGDAVTSVYNDTVIGDWQNVG